MEQKKQRRTRRSRMTMPEIKQLPEWMQDYALKKREVDFCMASLDRWTCALLYLGEAFFKATEKGDSTILEKDGNIPEALFIAINDPPEIIPRLTDGSKGWSSYGGDRDKDMRTFADDLRRNGKDFGCTDPFRGYTDWFNVAFSLFASWTSGSYQYDAAGCVTRITRGADTWDLTWNGQYQLVSVSTNGAFAEAYAYDALGRRVTTTNAEGTERHVYDDNWQVVADLDEDGNAIRSYVWGEGIDRLLAVRIGSRTYTALTDVQGTVWGYADEAGDVVARWTYDAWGNVLSEEVDVFAAELRAVRYRFQGRERSAATGLTNFRMRWYDAVTGRWLSKDPIGLGGGLNLYAFDGNDPMNRTDPSGLSFWGSFVRGFIKGAVVTAAVAATAAVAVAIGVPGAVITATLGAMGVVGGVVAIASAMNDSSADNLGDIAVGLAGGAVVGAGVAPLIDK